MSKLVLSLFFAVVLGDGDDSHDFATSDLHDDSHDDDDHDHDHEDEDVGFAMAITVIAGLAALLGACSIFCVKPEQLAVMPVALGFAAGVIVYLSFMNLIPESIEMLTHSVGEESEALAHFFALLCVIGGLAIAFVSEMLINHRRGDESTGSGGSAADEPSAGALPADSPATHKAVASGSTAAAELEIANVAGRRSTDMTDDGAGRRSTDITEDVPAEQNSAAPATSDLVSAPENLSNLSYSVAVGLILHHLPEGIATFVSLLHDVELGFLVTFGLAVHDIPTGVCIAVPVYFATGSMLKPFLLCIVAAVMYPIGGLIGWAVVEGASEAFEEGFTGVLFGITGGIMTYLAFVDLLPTAIITAKRYSLAEHEGKYKNIYEKTIVAIFVGFLVMDISSIVLAVTGGHSH